MQYFCLCPLSVAQAEVDFSFDAPLARRDNSRAVARTPLAAPRKNHAR
jgi:hypothetical protein